MGEREAERETDTQTYTRTAIAQDEWAFSQIDRERYRQPGGKEQRNGQKKRHTHIHTETTR